MWNYILMEDCFAKIFLSENEELRGTGIREAICEKSKKINCDVNTNVSVIHNFGWSQKQ